MSGRARVALVLAVISLAGSAGADGRDHHEVVSPPAIPRWMTLPIEYSDAVVWTDERPGPVYRMSGGAMPGVQLGCLSLHVPLEGYYRNPGGDFGVGLRATYVVWAPVAGMLPLRAMGQASYLVRYHALHWEGGAMVGLGTLVHAAVAYGSDTDRKLSSVAIRIGYNVLAAGDPVSAITHFVPEAPLPELGD